MTTQSKNIKIAIVLVTSLFFLWGVSYGLIDVMNKNFQNHLHITQHESGFLQLAYFGAYFIIALPAGYIASKFSYKIGIIFWFSPLCFRGFAYHTCYEFSKFSFIFICFFCFSLWHRLFRNKCKSLYGKAWR